MSKNYGIYCQVIPCLLGWIAEFLRDAICSWCLVYLVIFGNLHTLHDMNKFVFQLIQILIEISVTLLYLQSLSINWKMKLIGSNFQILRPKKSFAVNYHTTREQWREPIGAKSQNLIISAIFSIGNNLLEIWQEFSTFLTQLKSNKIIL